jgi:AraC-like DNA-binding protein
MLTPKEGAPKALRKLLAEQLLPLMREAAGAIRLAAPGDGGGNPVPQPPDEPGHRHFFTEICFCLAGEAEFWAGGALQRVCRADVLVAPPGMVHSPASLHAVTIPAKTAYSRLLWLALFPYGCVLNLCESSAGQHFSTPRQLVVERHAAASLQAMLLELKTGDEYAPLIARCKLIEGLAWLCRGDERHWTDTSAGGVEPPSPSSVADMSIAGRARRFIEEHFDQRLDLDTIAQAVSTNKSNLCRVFRNNTGSTVGKHLTTVRIDAGKRLLLTSLPVAAVAKLVGFDDPYYFSRVFHRETGLSPTGFRTQIERQRRQAQCEA